MSTKKWPNGFKITTAREFPTFEFGGVSAFLRISKRYSIPTFSYFKPAPQMHLPLFGKPGVTWLQVGGGGMGLWPIAGGEGRWLQARGAGRGGCKAGRGEEDNMWLDGRAWPGQTGLVASRVFFEYMYWDLCQVVCWVMIAERTFGLVSELGVGGGWAVELCVDHICNGRRSLLRPLSLAGRGQGHSTKTSKTVSHLYCPYMYIASTLSRLPSIKCEVPQYHP